MISLIKKWLEAGWCLHVVLFLLIGLSACTTSELELSQHSSIIIKLDNLNLILDDSPELLGQPIVVVEDGITGVRFNGIDDGIILHNNPLYDLDKFTIQVLFKPYYDGLREQRFIHFQDTSQNRVLIETRLNDNNSWYFDTFLYHHEPNSRLTLIDEGLTHPTDNWYWVALSYDGEIMRHYVNGVEELSGTVNFGPMESGQMSIGVRLNKVHWFKGIISEIHIHDRKLNVTELYLHPESNHLGFNNVDGFGFDTF